MKKTIKFAAALLIGTSLLSTGCLEETFPQQGDRHRGSGGRCAERLQQLRHSLHLDLAGEFLYAGNTNMYPYDFGYPSFLLQRDVMGQDIALEDTDTNSSRYGTPAVWAWVPTTPSARFPGRSTTDGSRTATW